MNNAKRLLRNTLLLTATAFLMRTAAVSFNVYLTNRIGASGIGLFQLISAVYGMAVTFASAGIRLASMRLAADSLSLGMQNQRQIMRRALVYGCVCGIIFGSILYIFAGQIASVWIGSAAAASSLRMLGAALPFVSMSAALNGYFTAVRKIMRYTFAQLMEQVFRIVITVLLLRRVSTASSALACQAIVTGITLAEVFSMSLSFLFYRISSKTETKRSGAAIWRSLLRIALPDALGASVRSALSTVEHLLIPKGLKRSGRNTQQAIATYGIVHGMALPIVLYPSALLSSLSGLLGPEISALYLTGSRLRIRYMTERVLHLTLLFSVGTAGILYFTADRLALAFYRDPAVGSYLRVLAPLIPVMYCDMSVDGMLKGLDQQFSYMKYNIIDATSCVVLVVFLVPLFSVRGYLFVIYFSEILNFVLSFRRLTVVSDVELNAVRDLLIPICCVLAAGETGRSIFAVLPNLSDKASAALYIAISTCVYAGLLRLFHAVDPEEARWLRGLIK